MKKEKALQVVVKRVGEGPQIETWKIIWEQVSDREIFKDNRAKAELGVCQPFVGGSIEPIDIGGGFSLICNANGLVSKLPPNCCGFVGNFFFSKYRNGWLESLTQEECRKCLEWVQRHEDRPAPSGPEPFRCVAMDGEEYKRHLNKLAALRKAMEKEWASL